jgi:hypothetical protein
MVLEEIKYISSPFPWSRDQRRLTRSRVYIWQRLSTWLHLEALFPSIQALIMKPRSQPWVPCREGSMTQERSSCFIRNYLTGVRGKVWERVPFAQERREAFHLGKTRILGAHLYGAVWNGGVALSKVSKTQTYLTTPKMPIPNSQNSFLENDWIQI